MDADLLYSCRSKVQDSLGLLDDGGTLTIHLVGGGNISAHGNPGQEGADLYWFEVTIKTEAVASIRYDQVAALEYTPARPPMKINR